MLQAVVYNTNINRTQQVNNSDLWPALYLKIFIETFNWFLYSCQTLNFPFTIFLLLLSLVLLCTGSLPPFTPSIQGLSFLKTTPTQNNCSNCTQALKQLTNKLKQEYKFSIDKILFNSVLISLWYQLNLFLQVFKNK